MPKHEETLEEYASFEVFTVVTMKNGIFWDVAPCGSCKNHTALNPRRWHSSLKAYDHPTSSKEIIE
jgi:hypothetical protein